MSSQQTKVRKVVGGKYLVTEKIGKGAFSNVWKARHKDTGREVAIKAISKGKLNPKLTDILESEIGVLKDLDHPNIVKLIEIFKTDRSIYIVLEYCTGGDLSKHLKKHGKITQARTKILMKQIAEGLKFCHHKQLIHRDLKPQNILLTTDISALSDEELSQAHDVIKLADFGFARMIKPFEMAETLCGSPLYMAPEVLEFKKYDGRVDIWSIGVIMYEMLVGKPPFEGINHLDLMRNIKKARVKFPADLEPATKGYLVSLLREDPKKRMGFHGFFNDPYITGRDPNDFTDDDGDGDGDGVFPELLNVNMVEEYGNSDEEESPTVVRRNRNNRGNVTGRGSNTQVEEYCLVTQDPQSSNKISLKSVPIAIGKRQSSKMSSRSGNGGSYAGGFSFSPQFASHFNSAFNNASMLSQSPGLGESPIIRDFNQLYENFDPGNAALVMQNNPFVSDNDRQRTGIPMDPPPLSRSLSVSHSFCNDDHEKMKQLLERAMAFGNIADEKEQQRASEAALVLYIRACELLKKAVNYIKLLTPIIDPAVKSTAKEIGSLFKTYSRKAELLKRREDEFVLVAKPEELVYEYALEVAKKGIVNEAENNFNQAKQRYTYSKRLLFYLTYEKDLDQADIKTLHLFMISINKRLQYLDIPESNTTSPKAYVEAESLMNSIHQAQQSLIANKPMSPPFTPLFSKPKEPKKEPEEAIEDEEEEPEEPEQPEVDEPEEPEDNPLTSVIFTPAMGSFYDDS